MDSLFIFRNQMALWFYGVKNTILTTFVILTTSILTSGCIPEDPNKPPADAKIFTAPIAGANIGPGPSGVMLGTALTDATQIKPGLSGGPGICYSIDGSEPGYTVYNGKVLCTGTSSKPYENAAWVRCAGAEETVTKTLTILYLWDNGDKITKQITHANYIVDCVPPPAGAVRFSITGGGLAYALDKEIGTIDILSGFGQFDPATAKLTFSIVAKLDSSLGVIGISTNNIVPGTWEWTDESNNLGELSNVSAESQFGSCQSLGNDPFDLCSFSDVLNGPMYVKNDPIEFDLGVGGKTTFQTEAVADLGALGNITSSTTVTLTALP